MGESPFEDRARAIKASKIVRVLRRVIDADPTITIDDLAHADDTFRHRVADLAKVRVPSERSWAVALAILHEQMADA